MPARDDGRFRLKPATPARPGCATRTSRAKFPAMRSPHHRRVRQSLRRRRVPRPNSSSSAPFLAPASACRVRRVLRVRRACQLARRRLHPRRHHSRRGPDPLLKVIINRPNLQINAFECAERVVIRHNNRPFAGRGLGVQSRISTHAGAWSLAFDRPRTLRSTPAATSLCAMLSLMRK